MQFRISEIKGKFTPEVKHSETFRYEPLSGYRKSLEEAQKVIDEYVTTPIYHEYTPTPILTEQDLDKVKSTETLQDLQDVVEELTYKNLADAYAKAIEHNNYVDYLASKTEVSEDFLSRVDFSKVPTIIGIDKERWSYKKKLFNLLEANRRVIINGSRQIGLTSLLFEYIIKETNVRKRSVAYVSYRKPNPYDLMLKNGYNKHEGTALSKDTEELLTYKINDLTDLEKYDVVVIDNADFIEGLSKLDILKLNKVVIATTAIKNPLYSEFLNIFEIAQTNHELFTPVKLPWHVHPLRNQEWIDTKTKELGKLQSILEYDAPDKQDLLKYIS